MNSNLIRDFEKLNLLQKVDSDKPTGLVLHFNLLM